jgi:hypothetical protein
MAKIKWSAKNDQHTGSAPSGHLYSVWKNRDGYNLKVTNPGPASTVGGSAYYGAFGHDSPERAKQVAERHAADWGGTGSTEVPSKPPFK